MKKFRKLAKEPLKRELRQVLAISQREIASGYQHPSTGSIRKKISKNTNKYTGGAKNYFQLKLAEMAVVTKWSTDHPSLDCRNPLFSAQKSDHNEQILLDL